MDWSRRKILSGIAGAGSLALAGCSGQGNPTDTQSSKPTPGTRETEVTERPTPSFPESDWFVRPASEPEAVPPLSCETEEFVRAGGWLEDELVWGGVRKEGELVYTHRVERLSYEVGETVHVVFRNVSDEPRSTGNPHKIDLSIFTEDGWVDVRGFPDGRALPVTDDLWELDAGAAHEWQFPLTENGIIEASTPSHQDHLSVCPALKSGRYRFGFGGVEPDSAVAFDVTT